MKALRGILFLGLAVGAGILLWQLTTDERKNISASKGTQLAEAVAPDARVALAEPKRFDAEQADRVSVPLDPATDAAERSTGLAAQPLDLDDGEAGASGVDPLVAELKRQLEEKRARLNDTQEEAVERQIALGDYEHTFVVGKVDLSPYSNLDLPTSVRITAVENRPGVSDVKVVTLSREAYPDVCQLYDDVRWLQQAIKGQEQERDRK